MCGIVGFTGKGAAAPLLLEGLRKLEYRGYDSAGIAMLDAGKITVVKKVGKIAELEQELEKRPVTGSTAISHCRWATMGKVTEQNAHPHLDCSGKIAVVHNGIIENFQELRGELKKKGHSFRSETDTEVLAHLVEEELKDKRGIDAFRLAVCNSLKRVAGSYACLFLWAETPDEILAVRDGSPLLLAGSKKGAMAASDALPLLGFSEEAIILREKEIAVLKKTGEIEVYGMEGGRKIAEKMNLDWDAEQAEKNGFNHFMEKEIAEEPEMIARTVAAQDRKLFEEIGGELVRTERVMFVACGTSRHAALIGRYLFNKMAEKYCDVMIGSEFQYFAGETDRKTLIVAVSQSGETADVLEGVKKAKERGARIVSIVNVPGSSLDRLADKTIFLSCGPEIGVAATKTFMSQLAVFYLLAFAAMGRFEEGKEKLGEMAGLVKKIIDENREAAKKLAQKIKGEEAAYFIARGINFAAALEGALKFKEITYIHAEGMPAGELKHGTLALVRNGTPVVVLNPNDYTYGETLANGLETKARGAFLIGVSDRENEEYDERLKIPRVEEIFYPFVSVVPLQLLAYYTAVAKGNDPDRPRNLAKSVTVK